MRVIPRCATALLVAAGVACASSGGGGGGGAGAATSSGYVVPASSANIRMVAEMLPGPPPQQRISVQNQSSVGIVISGVRMVDCVNLGRLCDRPGGNQRIIRVRPGQREMILQTGASDPDGNFGYRVRFDWRPDVGDLTAPAEPVTEEMTITSSGGRTAARPSVMGGETPPEPYPFAALETLRRSGGRVRVAPDSVELRVGERRSLNDFQISLVDAAGTTYTKFPFGFRVPPTELAFRQPNFVALAPGRAVVEFTVPPGLVEGATTTPTPAQVVFIIRP